MAAADAANAAAIAAQQKAADAAAKAAADAAAKALGENISTAASYGISEALFNDPIYGDEIKAIFDLFKANQPGPALEALFKSRYYKELSSTVRNRMKTKMEQPGQYTDALNKYKISARKRLVTAGIKIDQQEFDKLAATAYDRGLDDNQFDELIKFSGKISGFGGNILGDTTSLKSYANSFGVGKYLGDAYWKQKSADLFIGRTTIDDIQAEIRATAASAFPGYADQINNGISVDAIGSAYKGAMATILERDADSITFEDPILRSALQYVGPDGKPAVKPLWQFEKELKSRPEWEYTNNARDTMDSLTLKVFRDMGIA